MNDNLPLGANYDSSAPWNESAAPLYNCGSYHLSGDDFCRTCEISGECITAIGKGYIFDDGEKYFSTEKYLLQYLKKEFIQEFKEETNKDILTTTKEEILKFFHENNYYYYTEFY